ncbi:MAG: hypothetical protein PWQ39_175 [Thermacetogenium sp.]|nr:hypothetical protein [Thermacetogenium sp.]
MKLASESGQVLIEFVFAVIIFAAFIYGLFAVSWWGIGAVFVQEAAHEAAGKYAVTLDEQASVNRAVQTLSLARIFLKKDTVRVAVWKEGDQAAARVSAEPLVSSLYLYRLPLIEKTSSCTLECRFRR